MVSLTKTRPVDSLLSRFRLVSSADESCRQPIPDEPSTHAHVPARPHDTVHGADIAGQADPADKTQSAAAIDASRSKEIVPYRPPVVEDTLSQQERRARADAGDLQARLDLIPLDVVEDQLSRRFRTTQPDCSILSFLGGLDGSATRHLAASTVLDELADTTEQAALTSALVYRYIQAHALWKDHPNPEVDSAEAFLDTLDNADHVKANIVIGTSAQLSKRRSIRVIEDLWGPGWFERIPEEIRDPGWTRAEECSKRTLTQMIANAKQGYSLPGAVEHWGAAMRTRTNETARRERRITQPRSPYIILDDVRSLNKDTQDTQDTGRSRLDDKEDRLMVELVAPHPPPGSAPSKPSQSPPARRRPNAKRKRALSKGHLPDKATDDDGWRKSSDGTCLLKRAKNQLLRKPVEVEPHSSDDKQTPPPDDPSSQLRVDELTPPPDETPSDEISTECSPGPPSCDGPSIALLLVKFADLYDEICSHDPDTVRLVQRCCDSCRGYVLRALASFKGDIMPCVEGLQRVDRHVFNRHEIPPSQDHGISPHKPPARRYSAIVVDSSDVD